jgi:sugar diacid utilization regulator
VQKGMEAITWTQKKILPVFAKCNMSSRKTAEEIFLSPGDVDYHLRMIEIKTGLNPRVFVDLVKLLFLCGEGNMFGLGELL